MATKIYTDNNVCYINDDVYSIANLAFIVDGEKFGVKNLETGLYIEPMKVYSQYEDADGVQYPDIGTIEASIKSTLKTYTQTGDFTGITGYRVYIGATDPVSDLPVVVDFEHHQVHEGETYIVNNKQLSLGTGTVKYKITVPAYANTIYAPHMVIGTYVNDGTVLIDIYEGGTITGGTPQTSYNRNRNSGNVAHSTITLGVTASGGLLLYSFFGGAGNRSAGDNRSSSELILKSDSEYYVEVKGLLAGTEAIIYFNWYEDLGV